MSYEIAVDAGVLFIVLQQSVTKEDLLALSAAIRDREKEQKVFFDRIVDIRSVSSSDVDYQMLSGLQRICRPTSVHDARRTAIIVQSSFQFGFARMWKSIDVQTNARTKIFRDQDSARIWLQESQGSGNVKKISGD